MSCEARRVDLKIIQGSTFKRPLRYLTDLLTFKAISAISAVAPATITATAHGIPDNGWPFRVSGVGGMVEINSPDDNPEKGYAAIVVDANTLQVKNLDASRYSPYTSGGYIAYNTPVDLSAFDGTPTKMRAQIRESSDSDDVLLELTDDNGRILIDNTTKKITLLLDAETTAAIEWDAAFYALEGISASGEITPIAYGAVRVIKDVVREP